MKNIFKRLAVLLAVVIVATLLGPVSEASAASKITLKNGKTAPSTIYTGKSCYLKVANAKVVFTSSNKSIATVGYSTGKVVAKAPGTVTIYAKNKTTKKTIATQKFTVNQRATSVATDVTSLNLLIGDTYTLVAKKTPATSTDVVRFYSSNKAVATVGLTTGKVTAVSEGTARITVYSKATRATSNSSTYNKIAYVDVTVNNAAPQIVQVSTTQIKMTFNDALTSVNASQFSVKESSVGRSLLLKSATLDESNKKEVILTTYEEMKDGKTYSVTYGAKTYTFTATDSEVASLTIVPATVYTNEETTVSVVTKDKNGVVLGEYAYGSTPSNITFQITCKLNSYMTGDKLVISQQGVTVIANATYHTNKFDASSNEIGVIKTGDVTIVAVDKPAATVSTVKYTIGGSTRADFASSSYTQNTKVALDETKYLSVMIIDSNNKEITNYSDYTLESSDSQVLLVAGELSNTKASQLYPVTEGSANILVKNKAGAYVATLPVTVVGERKATTVDMDKNNFTLSNSVIVNQTGVSTVKVKDQYGDVMPVTKIEVTLKNASSEAVTKTFTGKEYATDLTKGTITFYGSVLGKGTYIIEVLINGIMRPVTINVVEPSSTQAAVSNIMLGDQVQTSMTVDSSVLTAADVDKKFPIRIVSTRDGVLDGYQNITAITVNNGTNNDLVVKDGNDYYFKVNTSTSVSGLSNVVTKTASGTYQLVIKSMNDSAKVETRTAVIVVTDSQPTMTATQKSIQYTNSTLTDTALATAALKECFEFTINGVKVDTSNITFDFANSSYTLSNDYLVIRKLKLYVNNTDLKCAVEYNLDVSKSITLK